MEQALELAAEAAASGEVPVGAVIVRAGKVVGRGRNRMREAKDPRAHAEMEAIAGARAATGSARLDGDTLYVFNSWNHPSRSAGRDVATLGPPRPIQFVPDDLSVGNRWIEATWPGEDGILWGWYHNEPKDLCPGSETRTKYGLTAPRIGAVRSRDNGATWEDLGLILTAPPGTLDCQAENGYFAGGHGDFSVMLDARREWLYIFFGNYAGDPATQGVAVARMRWADRASPVGKVWKHHAGAWAGPGVGGRTGPIHAAAVHVGPVAIRSRGGHRVATVTPQRCGRPCPGSSLPVRAPPPPAGAHPCPHRGKGRASAWPD